MVVPPLLQLAHNRAIAPFALPALLQASRRLQPGEFASLLEPELSRLCSASMKPGNKADTATLRMLLQLAQHAEVLLELASEGFARDTVVPLLTHALDAHAWPEVHVAALK